MHKLSEDFMLSNDEFSKYYLSDLSELLKCLKEYKIKYRDKLGLAKKVTFGLEIEFSGAKYRDVKRIINYSKTNYVAVDEVTVQNKINKNIYGGEVVSPILKDNPKTWYNLSKICTLLKEEGAFCNEKCGAHVNIGAQVFYEDIETWRNLFKIWTIYEDIIFQFSYGEDLIPFNRIYNYSNPMADEMKDLISKENYKDLIGVFNIPKKWAINFNKVKNFKCCKNNVIEFRVPNGTVDEIIWQNNVNFFSKLLLACKDIDSEFLDYKLNQIRSYNLNKRIEYNEYDIEKTLELVDLLFDNNLDKINFLKQYVKKDYNLVKRI